MQTRKEGGVLFIAELGLSGALPWFRGHLTVTVSGCPAHHFFDSRALGGVAYPAGFLVPIGLVF